MNSLCDNSDAYILHTGNIAAKNANDANLGGWGGRIRGKRSVYWNKYKMIEKRSSYDANASIREMLDTSYQGVIRLLVCSSLW